MSVILNFNYVYLLLISKTKMPSMNTARFFILTGMILIIAVSRCIPHPPNFSPVAALALFAGASFASKRIGLFVSLAGLYLSDLILGFYTISPVVYGSFALIVYFDLQSPQKNIRNLVTGSFTSATIFFVLTNFGVWAFETMYSKTWGGLAECFIAAIPFFSNTFLSNLFYSALLFGSLRIAERYWPDLVETAPLKN